MTGLEQRITGVGGNRSTNCTTTTALILLTVIPKYYNICWSKHPSWVRPHDHPWDHEANAPASSLARTSYQTWWISSISWTTSSLGDRTTNRAFALRRTTNWTCWTSAEPWCPSWAVGPAIRRPDRSNQSFLASASEPGWRSGFRESTTTITGTILIGRDGRDEGGEDDDDVGGEQFGQHFNVKLVFVFVRKKTFFLLTSVLTFRTFQEKLIFAVAEEHDLCCTSRSK